MLHDMMYHRQVTFKAHLPCNYIHWRKDLFISLIKVHPSQSKIIDFIIELMTFSLRAMLLTQVHSDKHQIA